MMTTTDGLAGEVEAAELHLARVDVKAGVLLGLNGAAAAVGVTTAPALHLAGIAGVAALASVAAFILASGLLTVAIRPALRSRSPYGFALYAVTLAADIPGQVEATAYPDPLAERLVAVSGSILRKYRYIRTACDLSLLGLAAATITAAAGTWL